MIPRRTITKLEVIAAVSAAVAFMVVILSDPKLLSDPVYIL